MSRKLTILFVPNDTIKPVDTAIGTAQVLIETGHRVIFTINQQWRGRLVKYGIEEVFLTQNDQQSDEGLAKELSQQIVGGGAIKSGTPLETGIEIRTKFMPIFIEENEKLDKKVEQLLKDIKPDVIVLDQALSIPSVKLSGIPWVLNCGFPPLFFIKSDETHPHYSEPTSREAEIDLINQINGSPYLNIYGFPKELDYSKDMPLEKYYYRFDNMMRREVNEQHFEIPEQLRGKPGKLIYFSLGLLGGVDIQLMKRLIAILSKSPHRFIVSKGPLHNQYELPDNMWGQQSVPQTQVLSIVDLVITHGGNNTVCETFFYGKPMIVMPMFSDPFVPDNGKFIRDKGLGLRLNPYDCTEDQLLKGIESLLNDKQLNEKLKNISKRIQTENSIAKLPKLIENLVK